MALYEGYWILEWITWLIFLSVSLVSLGFRWMFLVALCKSWGLVNDVGRVGETQCSPNWMVQPTLVINWGPAVTDGVTCVLWLPHTQAFYFYGHVWVTLPTCGTVLSFSGWDHGSCVLLSAHCVLSLGLDALYPPFPLALTVTQQVGTIIISIL